VKFSGCVSPTRTAVSLTLIASPDAPKTDGDITKCFEITKSITASVSVPSGIEVVWYDAAVGGSIVDDPILSAVGSATYYAEAVNEAGCVSAGRTPVKLTLNLCDDEDDTDDIDDGLCENETAYGGDFKGGNDPGKGGNGAWWYYFDTAKSNVQKIYAGQKETDGTVTYQDGNLIIDLGSNKLKDGSMVKIYAFDERELPTKGRPAPGKANYYKGRDLKIKGNGSRYYVIHLGVEGNCD
jgi:hypothetical protein